MAFSITAVFGLDTTGVRTELRQLRREFNSFATSIGSLGLAAVGAAFVGFSKSALDLASSLKDSALQLGVNVEALQALQYAATQNGSSVESMNKSLEKLRLSTQEAKDGNKDLAEAFSRLGLNVDSLLKLPLEKQYEAVAKSLAKAKDSSAAFSDVSKIFGTKIGPDQIAVLKSLAQDGFAKTAKEAAAAGHIMKSETIVALEQASQAIDDFKKKATIAVGNILVNFRSEEGLKLLGLQLLRVVGVFGAKMVDALSEVNQYVGAVITGTFVGIGNKFRDSLLSAVVAVAGQLNRILPEKLKIDIGAIDGLKSSGEGVAGAITRAIAETKPGTFVKDVSSFWDKAIGNQQKVVDNLNKVDFGKGATELNNAGKEIKTSAESYLAKVTAANAGRRTAAAAESAAAAEAAAAAEKLRVAGLTVGEALADGAVTWEEGQKRWSDNITRFLESIRQIGGLIAGIRGGAVFNNLSDKALAEVVRQNRSEAGRLRNPALTRTNIGNDLEAGRLEAEALNAQQELDVRNRFRSSVGLRGVDAARRDFDPVVFERLLRDFGEGAEAKKQTSLLEDIREDQKRGNTALAVALAQLGNRL